MKPLWVHILKGALPTQHRIILGIFFQDPLACSFLVPQSAEQGEGRDRKGDITQVLLTFPPPHHPQPTEKPSSHRDWRLQGDSENGGWGHVSLSKSELGREPKGRRKAWEARSGPLNITLMFRSGMRGVLGPQPGSGRDRQG